MNTCLRAFLGIATVIALSSACAAPTDDEGTDLSADEAELRGGAVYENYAVVRFVCEDGVRRVSPQGGLVLGGIGDQHPYRLFNDELRVEEDGKLYLKGTDGKEFQLGKVEGIDDIFAGRDMHRPLEPCGFFASAQSHWLSFVNARGKSTTTVKLAIGEEGGCRGNPQPPNGSLTGSQAWARVTPISVRVGKDREFSAYSTRVFDSYLSCLTH